MAFIVITGATSGIGAAALEELATTANADIVVGTRARTATARALPSTVTALDLDLASLRSVRAFGSGVLDHANGRKIDTLICNAGVLEADVAQRTAEAFERTIGVNHLAHYLLIRLLQRHLDADAVVVLTTSGTHDPQEGSSRPTPRHADVMRLAFPERDPTAAGVKGSVAAGQAYAASKLCNILTARELSAKGVQAVAYCPGITPGTGLARAMPLPMRMFWRIANPVVRRAVAQGNRVKDAGAALAGLALNQVKSAENRTYVALRNGHIVAKEPSVLAQQADVQTACWRDSAALVGLDDAAEH